MNSDRIEWMTGRVQYWHLALLDEAQPLTAQAHELKEDLAQIDYPGGVVLDVGWYPEFSKSGAFEVCVVRNDEWVQPLFRTKCSTLAVLREAIVEAVTLAAELATQRPSER